jgi:hypothetical protein
MRCSTGSTSMYRKVKVVLDNGDVFEGVLIPPTQFSEPDVVVVKLRNGYNVGFRRGRVKEVVDLGEVQSLPGGLRDWRRLPHPKRGVPL